MTPKITVLMPVYNGEKYLKEAIESILSQTFADFEFFIINDGSTDNSVDIIKSYSDKRIIFIENEQNIGLPATLNKGIDLARSKYIARMDQDDISLSERLEKQFYFMEKNHDIDICGSWIKFFGEQNFVAKYAKTHREIMSNSFSSSPMAHPTVFFRKKSFDKYNLRYNSTLKFSEDYELWIRALKYLKFANLQEVLLNYRISPNQMTKSTEKMENANKIIWKTQLENLGVELNDEELNMHQLLMCEKYQMVSPEACTNWFDKIIVANREKQFYDTKILMNIFRHKWYVAYKTTTKFNIGLFFSTKYKYLSLKNKLRFLLRLVRNKQ